MSVPSQMRAAVLGRPGQITVARKAVPELATDEVLVRVERASLCGTDLKIRSHKFFAEDAPPHGMFTPGHEYAGVVVAVGSSVDEVSIGDGVVTEAHRGCMRCKNCLRGSYTGCLNYGNVRKGHRAQGMTVDGGFAEYAVNHVSTVHKLPSMIDFDDAVVLTTAGTVMHAVSVLGSALVGASVAVIGPGPIGLLCVQIARQLGADFVALSGTRDSRLEMGKRLGADVVANVRREDAVAAVQAATGGRGVEVVFECSGSVDAVDQALAMASRSGSVVLVGFFEEPVAADLNLAVMNEVTIHAVRGEGSDSVPRAISLAARGRLDLRSLITHRFDLDDIGVAFDTYAQRREDAIKVMINVGE